MPKKKTAEKTAKKPAKQVVISFRASDELVEALDSYVEELAEDFPGGNWTRSSAAMNAVSRHLNGYRRTPKA